MSEYKFEMTGLNGTLCVTENSIIINRHGANAFACGLRGNKEIPFSSITAVQFKEAGKMIKGFLQFSILGGNEATRGINDAWYDENTIMIKNENNIIAKQIRDYVQSQLGKPQATVISQSSSADELLKYKQLLDLGAIS